MAPATGDDEWANGDGSSVEDDQNDESSEFEQDDSELDDRDEDASPAFRLKGRTILWLCQEGQIPIARKRFEWLSSEMRQEKENDDENKNKTNDETATSDIAARQQQLEKEVFQTGRDKNYALHELLMGGTSDRNAHQLTLQLLTYAACSNNNKHKSVLSFRDMLAARPPSHQRTALHWAAWGNANLEILRLLVQGYPEALVTQDKASHGKRTPYEILKHYYHSNRNDDNNNNTDTTRLEYLDQQTRSWTRHRLRLAVHMCVLRYFAPQANHNNNKNQQHQQSAALTPFDEKHRKENAKMRPKVWFILSVLGSLVQREMTPLAVHILGFVGKDAKVATVTRKRKLSGASTKRGKAFSKSAKAK